MILRKQNQFQNKKIGNYLTALTLMLIKANVKIGITIPKRLRLFEKIIDSEISGITNKFKTDPFFSPIPLRLF